MTIIQFIDSFYMSLAPFIGMCFIYKALQPKRSAKYAMVFFAAFIFCSYYTFTISDFFAHIVESRMIRQQIFIFSLFGSFIVYCFCFFSSSFKQRAAAAIMYLVTSSGTELLLMLCMFLIGSETIDDTHSNLALRLIINNAYLFFFVIIGSVAFYFFRKDRTHVPWQVTVSTISLFCSSICLMMTSINKRNVDFNSFRYISILSVISIFIIIASIFVIGKYMNKQEIFKQKFLWVKHMQELDVKYINSLQEKSEEIRHIQHDFKDNLSVLKILLDNGDAQSIDKAKSLITELSDQTDDSKIIFYTGNLVVNAVLSAKIDEAKKAGIQINTDIRIPKSFENISELDINILIINLLKNAIEACERNSDPDEKIIEFKMAVKNNFLIFKTVNTYTDIKLDSKGNLKTTKKDKENHGIGLTIIKNTVEKYNGIQSTNIEGNKFINIVSIRTDII